MTWCDRHHSALMAADLTEAELQSHLDTSIRAMLQYGVGPWPKLVQLYSVALEIKRGEETTVQKEDPPHPDAPRCTGFK